MVLVLRRLDKLRIHEGGIVLYGTGFRWDEIEAYSWRPSKLDNDYAVLNLHLPGTTWTTRLSRRHIPAVEAHFAALPRRPSPEGANSSAVL